MSKKFYLISLLFYFCALFMSAQNSLRLSPIFASGITAKCKCYILGVGRTKQKSEDFFRLG